MAERPERSVLATPASSRPMIEKALASAADAVFLDLEDAVAPAAKAAARESAIWAVRELNWGAKPRFVRINALDTPFFYRDVIDIGEAVADRLDLVLVPKVNRPEDVYVVATLLGQIEAGLGVESRIGLEVQIETAEGLVNCERIAAASPRIKALVFGPGDFAASVRMPGAAIGTPDEWDAVYAGHRFHHVMQRIVVAGRAAGVRVIDGPFADYPDREGLRRSCLAARALGFDGKWCIHPSQIDVVNEVFAPTAAETAWARRVVAAYEAAGQEGKGAIALDGRMIDAASLRMARSTLTQAAAVEQTMGSPPSGTGEATSGGRTTTPPSPAKSRTNRMNG